MTANQIAAASVRESERHNTTYEVETERHNKEVESLTEDANRITEDHNRNQERLQKEYNDGYLEYLNAAEEDKVYLEDRLNNIKEEMGLNDKWYNEQMADINRKNQESRTNYENAIAGIQRFEADLQAKRDYYENQKTEAQTHSILEEIVNQKKRLELEKEKIDKDYQARITEINNSYQLGMINAETRSAELHLAKEQYDENVRRWNETMKSQEESKTKLLEEQSKTEKTKRFGTGAQGVKNLFDIPIGLIDSAMPF